MSFGCDTKLVKARTYLKCENLVVMILHTDAGNQMVMMSREEWRGMRYGLHPDLGQCETLTSGDRYDQWKKYSLDEIDRAQAAGAPVKIDDSKRHKKNKKKKKKKAGQGGWLCRNQISSSEHPMPCMGTRDFRSASMVKLSSNMSAGISSSHNHHSKL